MSERNCTSVVPQTNCRIRIWVGGSKKFTASVNAYSINIDTHTSCLGSDRALWSLAYVVSVLSQKRSHGHSLHLLHQCDLSVSSTQTRTHCRDELSAHSGGQSETDSASHRDRSLSLVINLHLQLWVLTNLTALTLAFCMCDCTKIYRHVHANTCKYVHTQTWVQTYF